MDTEEKAKQGTKKEKAPRGVVVVDFDDTLYFGVPRNEDEEVKNEEDIPCAQEFAIVAEILLSAGFKIINGSQRLLLQVDNILKNNGQTDPFFQEQMKILNRVFPDRQFMLESDAEFIASGLRDFGPNQAYQLTDMRKDLINGNKTVIVVALNRRYPPDSHGPDALSTENIVLVDDALIHIFQCAVAGARTVWFFKLKKDDKLPSSHLWCHLLMECLMPKNSNPAELSNEIDNLIANNQGNIAKLDAIKLYEHRQAREFIINPLCTSTEDHKKLEQLISLLEALKHERIDQFSKHDQEKINLALQLFSELKLISTHKPFFKMLSYIRTTVQPNYRPTDDHSGLAFISELFPDTIRALEEEQQAGRCLYRRLLEILTDYEMVKPKFESRNTINPLGQHRREVFELCQHLGCYIERLLSAIVQNEALAQSALSYGHHAQNERILDALRSVLRHGHNDLIQFIEQLAQDGSLTKEAKQERCLNYMLDYRSKMQNPTLREAMQTRRVPGLGFFRQNNDFEQLLADIPEANAAANDLEHSQAALLS